MSQNKSYIDEKVAEFNEEWPSTESYTGGKMQETLHKLLNESYSKGREDERHDDSPMGEGLFEGRKLKELSRPELYRAIGRFDGLYRSALQSHE